jgi:hypothetical protein
MGSPADLISGRGNDLALELLHRMDIDAAREDEPSALSNNKSRMCVTKVCRPCWHEHLMTRVEQNKALSRKAKPIAFLFKARKMSETTK